MKFEEIFKEDGLYKADSFVKGFCFEIKDGFLKCRSYRNENDLFPTVENVAVHEKMLHMDFSKVLTRRSLFK